MWKGDFLIPKKPHFMKTNKHFLKRLAEKDGRILLATTRDEFEYSDYVEWCEINGLMPQGEDSEAFHRWCNETSLSQYEDDVTNMKASSNLERHFVITGTVGRWNGCFDIVPEIERSFARAFDRCTSGADDVDVFCTERYIEVQGHHHDATNILYLWPVKTKTDEDALQRRIDDGTFDPEGAYDRRFLERITDYLW